VIFIFSPYNLVARSTSDNANHLVPNPDAAEDEKQDESLNLNEPNITNSTIVRSILIRLDLSICGEYSTENGSANTAGTDAKPAVLIRGGDAIKIPICIRNGDMENKTWYFEALDSDLLPQPPRHGIHVSLDKTSVTVAGLPYQPIASYNSSGNGGLSPILDRIIVTVYADNNAELGQHSFKVNAYYYLGEGDKYGLGEPIYYNIIPEA